jgi:hypothetical protein
VHSQLCGLGDARESGRKPRISPRDSRVSLRSTRATFSGGFRIFGFLLQANKNCRGA